MFLAGRIWPLMRLSIFFDLFWNVQRFFVVAAEQPFNGGSRFTTNACSTEHNIPFPNLPNHIVLSKLWKLEREKKKERAGRRERLLQEPRLLHFAPLYSNIPAVTSTTRRFRENFRYRMSAPRLPQKFVKVGRKPNVNFKKIAVLDFVELTFLRGEDQPHMKIYFRRREELKVRGWI